MFYYIYFLLLKNNKIYTGYTNDLKLRLKSHELGKVESTKNLRPVKLIHYEAYLEKDDAQRREKFLKTSDGKRFREQQLSVLLSKLKIGQ